mmetsp:Transcript_46134/g.128322  ORF Transcript_46134/g.128322 Transcript_46134/m.128322 type:complete len:206 (-) Transcript_46134:26-643(-)
MGGTTSLACTSLGLSTSGARRRCRCHCWCTCTVQAVCRSSRVPRRRCRLQAWCLPRHSSSSARRSVSGLGSRRPRLGLRSWSTNCAERVGSTLRACTYRAIPWAAWALGRSPRGCQTSSLRSPLFPRTTAMSGRNNSRKSSAMCPSLQCIPQTTAPAPCPSSWRCGPSCEPCATASCGWTSRQVWITEPCSTAHTAMTSSSTSGC